MAAPCCRVQVVGSMLTKYMRACVLHNSSTLSPQVSAGFIPVRYKSIKKSTRVKDAKVDAVKTEQKFGGKEKKKALQAMKDLKANAVEEAQYLSDAPVDNVWLRKHYPPVKYSLEQAIDRHKMFAQPEMFDNMEGLLYLDMTLDLTTKKKTKFLQNIRQTILLPNEFPFGTPPQMLVMCKTEDSLNIASQLGAKTFGTPAEIIQQINAGVINLKDFTHVLATADCSSDIVPIRSHLRDRFPQKSKGNIGFDLKEMWNQFYNGYTYESQKLSEDVGKLQVPIGIMLQPTEDLVENVHAYVESICKERSVALGPFIKTMAMVAPPSPERFIVKVEDYVPGYKEEEFDSDSEDEAESAMK